MKMPLFAKFPPIARCIQFPAVAAVALLGLASLASAQDKVLRWHDSLDRATTAARTTGKPVFVVFRCVR